MVAALLELHSFPLMFHIDHEYVFWMSETARFLLKNLDTFVHAVLPKPASHLLRIKNNHDSRLTLNAIELLFP